MSSDFTAATSLSPEANRVWLALRFGWTIAEVYGRLRQELRWKRTPAEAPRLFLSDLNPTSGEQLWAAMRHLLFLAETLFPPNEKRPSLYQPPTLVARLPETMESLMRGEEKSLPPLEQVFAELNEWSRECWARLDAEASALAEAASLGASLADTFWNLRPPRGEATPARKETWHYLLGPQRLTALIRSIRRAEPYLSDGVGRMLRHSLWEWSMARELSRSRSGHVQVTYPLLYASRSLHPLRRLRQWLMKRHHVRLPEFTQEEEKHLWRQLRRQMLVWEHLLSDRPAAQLLRPSDWRQVRWIAGALYVVSALFLVAASILFVAALLAVGRLVVTPVLPLFVPPTKLEEWLALGSALVAVLAFLATQARQGVQRLRGLYGSVHGWALARKLDQRTLCAWNGRTKSMALIGLQRLLRAEDA